MKKKSYIGVWKDTIEGESEGIQYPTQYYLFGDQVDDIFDELKISKKAKEHSLNDNVRFSGELKKEHEKAFSPETINNDHGVIVFRGKMGWTDGMESEIPVELHNRVIPMDDDIPTNHQFNVIIHTRKSSKLKKITEKDIVHEKEVNDWLETQGRKPEFKFIPSHVPTFEVSFYSDDEINIPKKCIEGTVTTRSMKNVTQAVTKKLISCVLLEKEQFERQNESDLPEEDYS